MSPLALIPIGLYAITATVGAEITIENAETAADELEQKVTLTETIVPKEAVNSGAKARPNTSALATTAMLADPVVKKAFAKALQSQVEENNQRLVQQSNTDDPGQYFLTQLRAKTMADTQLRLALRIITQRLDEIAGNVFSKHLRQT